MNKDYTKYKVHQLLNDDYFLESELHPTAQDRQFWQQLQDESESFRKEMQIAHSFLKNIKSSTETSFLPEGEQKDLWKRIQTANNQYDSKIRRSSFLKTTAVAAVSLLALLTYGWYSIYSNKSEINYEAIIESIPSTDDPSKNVQLILSENKKLSIEGKETQLEYKKEGSISVNSQDIEVGKEKQEKEDVQSFSQLIVPVGKRSFVTFADGSKLWVNSGSKVIYPNKFSDHNREIFVEGEIYLDVVHDEKRPFIVKTKKIEIRDLGTQFNVSAYENDSNSDVVLVEGKVEVQVKGRKKNTLNPNQLFTYDNSSDKIYTSTVNTQDYVAWKDGYYQFKQQKMNIVLEKLCKYYGIKINWDEKVSQLTCSGKLDLKDDLDKVFNALRNAAPIEIEQTNEYINIIVKP